MKRIQNLLLVLWTLAMLLFMAFNWSLIISVVEMNYLFMTFQVRVVLWLALAGLGAPILFRFIGSLDTRSTAKRSEKEISEIKSKAYDNLVTEFHTSMNEIKEKITAKINEISASGGAPAMPQQQDNADKPAGETETDGKDGKD